MRISEIFTSVQGEGFLAGTPSVFIRTSFCNLRCRWCDTPYTSWQPEFVERDTASILSETVQSASAANVRHLVITGGEPFLQPLDLALLCTDLKHHGFHITIETNGTIFYKTVADLVSISPKLHNSVPRSPAPSIGRDELARGHDRLRLNLQSLRLFSKSSNGKDGSRPPAQPEIQVKFVVETEGDVKEIDRLVAEVPFPKEKILLMPQVTDQSLLPAAYATVKRLCARTGYRFSPRVHIERFGNVRGR